MNKKLMKLAGNILTVIAVVFVCKKLFNMELDYNIIFSGSGILWTILISLVYGCAIIIYGWPWKRYVQMITKARIPFFKVAFIMAKSNLLKYIPGNVFQYVGRNELAVRYGLKHSEVGMATFFDVATNLFAAFVLGCIFYLEGFLKVIIQLKQELSVILCIGIVVCIGLLFALWKQRKSFILKYLEIVRNRKNFGIICNNFVFYILNMLINSGLYIATLILMLGMRLSSSDVYILLGAFILAWIIGFVVPGAPGGIGIRELVMTMLIPGDMDVQMVLLGLVVYRLINVLGDIIGFLMIFILERGFRGGAEK